MLPGATIKKKVGPWERSGNIPLNRLFPYFVYTMLPKLTRVLLRSRHTHSRTIKVAKPTQLEDTKFASFLNVDMDELNEQQDVQDTCENVRKPNNRIPLQPVQDRSVILEDLPRDYNFYVLKKLMRQYGFVIRTNVVVYNKKYTGLVEFPTSFIAEDAVVKFNSVKLEGKLKINAKLESKSDLGRSLRKYICDCSVFVSYLPYNLTTDDVKAYFERAGPISGMQIARDMFGRCKDRGFIYYHNPTDAKKAIDLFNEKLFRGRTLVVRRYNID